MELVADHHLAGPDFTLRRAALAYRSEGPHLAVAPAAAPARRRLAMPALVNAHDHGYGIATLAVAAPDDALECWIPGLANRPDTDPRLEAAVAFGRMALSGIGTTVHCHNSGRRDRLAAEAEAVAAAAAAVGLRVAFSCPIADRNPAVYGDHAAVEALGLVAHAPRPMPGGTEQIAIARAVAAAHASPAFNVQFGPIGPQWCHPETLAAIAETSAATGMRIHMHLLETERQRQYLDSLWPDGPVAFLDRLGLLSPRLTVAHGVWLRADECALLAERGVTVAVNASSNLRLRSGIAPVARFVATGLAFALGLDGAGFDDDQDMFRELRLFQRLQSGMRLDHAMPAPRLLGAALTGAYRVFDGAGDYGGLADGARPDVVILDMEAMLADVVDDGGALTDLVIARARRSDVRDLVVAGRQVVADGRLTGFDLAGAEAELVAQARDRTVPVDHARQTRNREAIRAYYAGGRHRHGDATPDPDG